MNQKSGTASTEKPLHLAARSGAAIDQACVSATCERSQDGARGEVIRIFQAALAQPRPRVAKARELVRNMEVDAARRA